MKPRRYGLASAFRGGIAEGEGAPVNGIRYTSHPAGKYDADNHIAATLEQGAVRHALKALKLAPDRQPGESPQQYEADLKRLTDFYLHHAREHVHNNPDDILSRFYTRTADKARTPKVGHDPRKPGERYELTAPTLGLGELSAAVAPLLRKVAVDKGLKPRKGIYIPDVPPSLPPEPDHGMTDDAVDLLDPAAHEDYEALAASILNEPDVPRPTPRSSTPSPRTPFGVADELTTIPDMGHTGDDFDIPDVGVSPLVAEVEGSRVPRGPRQKFPTKEIHQAIADHLAQGGKHESVIPLIMDQFGLNRRQAGAHSESFKKLPQKPKPTVEPTPKPTGRLKPLGAKTRGTNRVYERVRRFAMAPEHTLSHYLPFYRAIGEDPSNVNTTVGAMADAGEESDGGPLANMYRKAFDQRDQRNQFGGHSASGVGLDSSTSSLYHSGHHSMWSPDRETLIQHSFNPTRNGTVLARVGATAFGFNGTGTNGIKGVNNGGISVELSPAEAEAVIRHLQGIPGGSFHWAGVNAGEDDRHRREPVTDPIAHLRNNLQAFAGDNYKPEPTPSPEEPPAEEQELPDDEPQQYQADRAPPGGIAVRGTFYEGGKILPEMDGPFVNPGRIMKARRKVQHVPG